MSKAAAAQKTETPEDQELESVGSAIALVPEGITPAKVYDGDVEKLVAGIEKIARSEAFDLTTAVGRKNCKSLAYKVSRTKTLLDDMGAELTEEHRKKVNAVNEKRKVIRDRLEALRDEVRKPVDEFEAQEETRMNAHIAALDEIEKTGHDAANLWLSLPLEQMKADMNRIRGDNRDFQEYAARFQIVRDAAVKALADAIAQREKHEKDQADLKRLREESEAREKKEREDRIAADAAAEAKRKAEEKAAADAKAAEEKAAAERKRLEDEAAASAAAEKKAREEKEAADKRAAEAEERRKREAKEAEEKAARVAKETEERAERERKATEERVERERKEAAEAERKRADDAKRAEDEAARKREADKKHHAKINNEALEAVLKAIEEVAPIAVLNATDKSLVAQAIVIAIAKGQVPHITIKY